MSISHLMILNAKAATNPPPPERRAHQQPPAGPLGHSLHTRYPAKITAAGSEDPASKPSLALRTRHEWARRATLDDAGKPEPATTDDLTKATTTQLSSTEPARKRVPIVKQVVATTNSTSPTNPATLADDAANPNAKPNPTTPISSPPTPLAKAPAVDTKPPPTKFRPATTPTSPAPPNNPAAPKTPAPANAVVAPTPTPEGSRGGAAKEKSAPPGNQAAAKPPLEIITSTPPAPSPAPTNTSQREITPNIHTDSPTVGKVPDSHPKENTSQLTSIAIGVACAASLGIFVILVVIFKIRVSRKKSRRQERFGDDLFGSHDRPSFSDSDGSRKSLFVIPRPFCSKLSSTHESAPEKPITLGNPKLTGIGAPSPPTESLADSSRNYPPAPIDVQSYPNSPPRPPRSPLRPQATQHPGAYYRPQGYGASQSYTPDTQSIYSTNTARGIAKAPEFYGHPTPEYNYAMEYLDNFYPNSHADSTYQTNQSQGDILGMDFMQVEDRPYDHRYTVDRNGVLNNYAPSIPTVARDSDYYYKKRVI